MLKVWRAALAACLCVAAHADACEPQFPCQAPAHDPTAPIRFVAAEQYHVIRQPVDVLPAGEDGRARFLSYCDRIFCVADYDAEIGRLRARPRAIGLADLYGYPDLRLAYGRMVVGPVEPGGRPKAFRSFNSYLASELAQFDLETGEVESLTLGYGIPIAIADMDHDGVDEVVTYTGQYDYGEMGLWSTSPLRVKSYFSFFGQYPVQVGDVDGDGLNELVTAKDVYRVQDGALVLQWHYTDGSQATGSDSLHLADVNGDGAKEIFSEYGDYVEVYDAKARTKLWEFRPDVPLLHSYGYGIGDVNMDGVPDLIASTQRHLMTAAEVIALDGRDGSILWRHAHDNHTASRPLVADLEGDGINEVLYEGFRPYTGPNRGVILEGADGSMRSRGPDLQGPMAFALGDLDQAGGPEVVAAIREDYARVESRYQVLSGNDLALVRHGPATAVPAAAYGGVKAVGLSHPSDGSAPKLAVGADTTDGPQVYVTDPATSELLTAADPSIFASDDRVLKLLFADLTGDGVEELIIGTRRGILYAIDPQSGQTLFHWGGMGYFKDSQVHGLRAARLRPGVERQLIVTVDPLWAQEGGELTALSTANAGTGGYLWKLGREFQYIGLDVVDLDDDGLDEVVAGTGLGEIHVRASDDGHLIRSAKVCEDPVWAVSRSAAFAHPSRVIAACGDHLVWFDAATGAHGAASQAIAEQLGNENNLEGFIGDDGQQRLLVAARQGLILLKPTANLVPRVKAKLVGGHWKGFEMYIEYEDLDGDPVQPVLEFPEGFEYSVESSNPIMSRVRVRPPPVKEKFWGVRVQADDGKDRSPPTTLPIIIWNRVPVVQEYTYEVQQGGQRWVCVITDADRDPVVMTIVTEPTKGTATGVLEGCFMYTPAPTATGTDTVQVRGNDGLEDSAVGTITFNISEPLPPAPEPQEGAGNGGGSPGPWGLLLGLVAVLARVRRPANPQRPKPIP